MLFFTNFISINSKNLKKIYYCTSERIKNVSLSNSEIIVVERFLNLHNIFII